MLHWFKSAVGQDKLRQVKKCHSHHLTWQHASTSEHTCFKSVVIQDKCKQILPRVSKFSSVNQKYVHDSPMLHWFKSAVGQDKLRQVKKCHHHLTWQHASASGRTCCSAGQSNLGHFWLWHSTLSVSAWNNNIVYSVGQNKEKTVPICIYYRWTFLRSNGFTEWIFTFLPTFQTFSKKWWVETLFFLFFFDHYY